MQKVDQCSEATIIDLIARLDSESGWLCAREQVRRGSKDRKVRLAVCKSV